MNKSQASIFLKLSFWCVCVFWWKLTGRTVCFLRDWWSPRKTGDRSKRKQQKHQICLPYLKKFCHRAWFFWLFWFFFHLWDSDGEKRFHVHFIAQILGFFRFAFFRLHFLIEEEKKIVCFWVWWDREMFTIDTYEHDCESKLLALRKQERF